MGIFNIALNIINLSEKVLFSEMSNVLLGINWVIHLTRYIYYNILVKMKNRHILIIVKLKIVLKFGDCLANTKEY